MIKLLSPRTAVLLLILSWHLPGWGDERPTSDAQPVIVGYLPDYRVQQIDASVGQYLTDIVYFSVVPHPDGECESATLKRPETIELFKRLREEYHVRIHLCVGGWNRSQGFALIAAEPASRTRFARGLRAYCLSHGFAGADIDWEHPRDAVESTNYGELLAELAREFRPHGLRLTAAMAGWQTLTKAGAEAVDAIHLMAYDADGRHSTLEQAHNDVQRMRDAGLPAARIRLGLPFYGRGIRERNRIKTYQELAKIVDSPTIDEVDGIYFNGPETIRTKTRFAREQKLGGVMIWEIGQDAQGDASLLKLIHAEMQTK